MIKVLSGILRYFSYQLKLTTVSQIVSDNMPEILDLWVIYYLTRNKWIFYVYSSTNQPDQNMLHQFNFNAHFAVAISDSNIMISLHLLPERLKKMPYVR